MMIISLLLSGVFGTEFSVELKPQKQNLKALKPPGLELKCIALGADVKFHWKFDNEPINLEQLDIKTKNNISTLKINPVTTVDTGKYQCCGVNGTDSACAHADVVVRFDDVDGTDTSEPVKDDRPDLCHSYPESFTGICNSYFKGKIVHADSTEKISSIENKIQHSLDKIHHLRKLSDRCGKFAPEAFCHYLLPTCLSNGAHQRLCRSDCEMLKFSSCHEEFSKIDDENLKMMANQFQCSNLPDIYSDTPCTSIGLPAVLNKKEECYTGDGIGYRGGENMTQIGKKCTRWDEVSKNGDGGESALFTTENFPELSGGHYFCRNPVNAAKFPQPKMSSPWCFVRKENEYVAEKCQIKQCEPEDVFSQEVMMVLLPSIAMSLVLILIGVIVCICVKRRPKFKNGCFNVVLESHNDGLLQPKYKETTYTNISIGQFGQNYKKLKLPELSYSSIILRKELGEAYYGVVYLADVLPNLLYSPPHPCAAKSLNENSNTQQIHQFWREMEMLSELRHDRIANLRAVVIQSQLRAMIFEYTDCGDLKNFLLARNPSSDVPLNRPLTLEQQIDICHQICEGMEYLSSGDRPYVHRDLAARNILISSNLKIKISNIGIARMETKNDYFNPQGANEAIHEPAQTLIPVRWMSPESLLEANYTMASDIWSYAVCCWEVFSSGTQPFCGFSNEEVMELVIHRKQVLPCPETCPLQIYNLLINCWSYVAYSRPTFTRIGSVLEQLKKNVPRKQYPTASTVSYNSQQGNIYRQRSQLHQYSHQPSSTDNSLVGGQTFYQPGSKSSEHRVIQRDQHAPPASPSSHSNFRYPTGTRSTTGSSADSSALGNMMAVPEELLRPLIPNTAQNSYNHEQNHLYRNNFQR